MVLRTQSRRLAKLHRRTAAEAAAMNRMLFVLCVVQSLLAAAAANVLWGHVEDARVSAAWKDAKFGILEGEHIARPARALIYPNNGVYKFIIGLGMPLQIPNKTIGLGVNFQFQYALPRQISQLLHPIVVNGRNDRHSRAALYGSMEMALDRRGLPGRACLLRAVCEAAETPLLHEGLLGEVLHLLLTPSLGHAPWELLAEYRAAEEAGAAGEDCAQRFAACPPGAGLLDHITCLRSLDDEDDDLWRRSPPYWDVTLDSSSSWTP